jgi:hypothetical protein
MSAFRRVASAALIASSLIAPVAGANAAPGKVCYFNDCTSNGTAPTTGTEVPTAADTTIRTLGEHGSWIAKTDGRIVMIIDRFADGAKFGIADMGDHWSLMLSNPSWSLKVGQNYPMKIEVDGEIYSGKAVADDGTTLILTRTTEEFVKAVYTGREARIKTVNDNFTMTLPEASAAMDDVASYRKTSSR